MFTVRIVHVETYHVKSVKQKKECLCCPSANILLTASIYYSGNTDTMIQSSPKMLAKQLQTRLEMITICIIKDTESI